MRFRPLFAISLSIVFLTGFTSIALAQGGLACDGVTGMTAAITNLITVATPGSQVQLPTGVCVLDSKLVIGKSISLIGASKTGTTLMLRNAVNADAIEVSASRVTILNLTVDGNVAGQTANHNAITFDDGLSELSVTNAVIQNAGNDCLHFGSNSSVQVQGNTLRGCGHNQLSYTSGTAITSDVWVLDNLIDGSNAGPKGFCAILIGPTTGALSNVILKDNIVSYELSSIETDGIVVSQGGTTGTVTNVVVAHNLVSSAGTPSGANNGIELWGVNQFVVGANVVSNAKAGILIDPCASCLLGGTIAENVISDSTSAGVVGIYERVPAVTITGNTVTGYASGTGILASGDSTSIASNSLYANGHQIIVRGNNSYVSANLVSGGTYGIISDVSANGLFFGNNKFANTFWGILFRATSYSGGIVSGNVFTNVHSPYSGIPSTGVSVVGVNHLVPCPAGKSAPLSINSIGELTEGACI